VAETSQRYSEIDYAADRIATITLNRPDKQHAHAGLPGYPSIVAV
jgi:1,4-dihydroxy-2-naphthoyl-CoA synthase